MAKKFDPSWRTHEKDMYHEDPNIQKEAGEKFLAERQHEIETDPQARRWEESRKAEAIKEKPQWVKQQRQKDLEPLNNLIKDLRKGGSFMEALLPSPGFLIIDPIQYQEGVTESGIFVPTEHSDIPNTAKVHRTSEYKVLPSGEKQSVWFKDGDKVLVRKGAGLDIREKGKELKFISFEDVLGVMV